MKPWAHRTGPQIVFWKVGSKAPTLTGKSGDFVRPVTNASPFASRAIP